MKKVWWIQKKTNRIGYQTNKTVINACGFIIIKYFIAVGCFLCVYMCGGGGCLSKKKRIIHIHTHTHIYICITYTEELNWIEIEFNFVCDIEKENNILMILKKTNWKKAVIFFFCFVVFIQIIQSILAYIYIYIYVVDHQFNQINQSNRTLHL